MGFSPFARALWLFICGNIIFLAMTGYCGLLIFATYHDCDPLTTKVRGYFGGVWTRE